MNKELKDFQNQEIETKFNPDYSDKEPLAWLLIKIAILCFILIIGVVAFVTYVQPF